MRSALEFAALLKQGNLGTEPTSYVTTGVHNTLELMVSTLGRSPNSSFVPRSFFSDALDLPQKIYFDFPSAREWEAAAALYRMLFAAYGVRPQDILLRLPNRRRCIGPHVHEYLVGLDTEWEEQLTRWTLRVRSALEAGGTLPPFCDGGGGHAERNGPVTGKRPVSDGAA